MLILDNINLRVGSFPRLYDSVMDVWIKSLTTMENIVSGVAQSIENPGVLLGLSAWHLYPDMVILDEQTTHIIQKDETIKGGGLVTIGMRGPKMGLSTGITWTMPLAQLRYYGEPVFSTRSIGTESLRLSFNDILYIAMGSVISDWGALSSDLQAVCKFFVAITARSKLEAVTFTPESEEQSFISMPSTKTSLASIRMLSKRASLFLLAKDNEKKEVTRLINLGQGRYKFFMAVTSDLLGPAFGLGNISTFLSILDVEGQINALRRLAENYDIGLDLSGAVILYRSLETNNIEFATLFTQQVNTAGTSKMLHRRWITPVKMADQATISNSNVFRNPDDIYSTSEVDVNALIRRTLEIMLSSGEPCGIMMRGSATDRDGKDFDDLWQDSILDYDQILQWAQQSNPDLAVLEEYCKQKNIPAETLRILKIGWQTSSSQHSYENKIFRRLISSESVMVYQPVTNWKHITHRLLLPLDFISSTLETLPLNGTTDCVLHSYFKSVNSTHWKYSASLANLYQVSTTYNQMPSATIDPAIASHPLHLAKWAHHRVSDVTFTRSQAFSMIVAFDSGGLEIKPEDCEDVIAMSSGSYLYVSEALLSDPASSNNGIRCLVGNIGKAGTALLLSPRNPIAKVPDNKDWEMINHDDFDGKWEDNFGSTSLHLKLTGYEMPINSGSHGGRYREMLYMEAVVSAHSRGEWIADIDILNLYNGVSHLSRSWIGVRLLPSTCQHTEEEQSDFTDFGSVKSIDNWPELLDRPPTSSVIRSKGNWDARLALSSLMRMRKDDVIIASGHMCWACARITADKLDLDPRRVLILS